MIDFGGARLFLTSKSNSSRFFALDGQIFRSVRRLGLIFGFFTVRTSTRGEVYGEEQGGQGMGAMHGRCGGKARVTEIPGGRSPPDPPSRKKKRRPRKFSAEKCFGRKTFRPIFFSVKNFLDGKFRRPSENFALRHPPVGGWVGPGRG